MSYHHIIELIQQYQLFEKETDQHGLAAFAAWVSHKPEPVRQPDHAESPGMAATPDEQIMQALGILANHARHYVKTASRGTTLAGWNDSIMLIVIYHRGPCRKTELIKSALIDLSSGIEVIKRLVRKGILEEYQDASDGRAKLVRLTKVGEALVEELNKRFDTASHIVAGNLSPEEKAQLVPLLFKLVRFHQPIFQDDYGTELEQIIEKYSE